ncbi:MAG: 6-phosphofructokinase [Clostridia bacterium]|nr:6-phosphofructokinase [Clostridia bacterium]
MTLLHGNMLIAHGGGPTPVINSSLQGAIEEAKIHKEINHIYGARFGVEGILAEDLMLLDNYSDSTVALLSQTPASVLGSCRRKLNENDYPKILECFKKFNIRYFFYNGGNDSMDTCHKIDKMADASGYEMKVIGIPKTIDNDLEGTDHSPGFGSAAKYAAVSTVELAQDAAALPIHVVVMELMGRNAGWITAASALYKDKMPCEHLIYLPELLLDTEKFLNDVKKHFSMNKGLLITVSEGLKYTDGSPVGDSGIRDGFGHIVPGGTAQALASLIMRETSLKSRAEKPGLLGRVSISNQSVIDKEEAYEAGAFAVRSSVMGKSGYMVAIEAIRVPEYSSKMTLVPLSEVANKEKKFPLSWINSSQNGVTDDFINYLKPLVGSMAPEYAVF